MLKIGLILVFFGRIQIGLVFGFCGCHFIGIGLVLGCHFPENGVSMCHLPTNSHYIFPGIGSHCFHLWTQSKCCPDLK